MESGGFKARQYILGGISLLAIAIVAISITSAVLLRDREIETWRRQLSDLSLVLAEQTSQSMVSADLALTSIVERVDALGIRNGSELRFKAGTKSIYEVLQDKITGLPQVDVATIIAGNGDVINFTRSYPAPKINLADREYFQAQRDSPALGLFISVPVKNKGNGKWVFYLSRRLNDSKGGFIGLVIVGISVEQLTGFYGRLGENLGEGAAMTLYRRDFSVLTRWPFNEEVIGKKNLTGTSHLVVEEMKKADDVIYSAGPRFFEAGLPVSRLGAVRALKRYPLIVNLTVTEDLFLGNWRHAIRVIGTVAFGSIAALMFAMNYLLRVVRQREASSSLLRDLTDQVPGMLFQLKLSPDGHTFFTYVSKGFLETYGLHSDQLPIDASKIFSYQHPDDRDRIRKSIQESARHLIPWHEDYRLILSGGAIVWHHGDAQPQKLKDGSILWHGFIADISERKQMEEAVRLSESFTKMIADNIPGMVGYWDHELRCNFASDGYLTWFGRTPEQMKNIRMQELMGDALFRLNEPYIRAVLRGENQQFERTLTKANGETGYTFAQYIAHKVDGEVRGFFVLVTDITAVKKSEEELRIAAVAFETQNGMMITDHRGIIIRINTAFTRLTGYSAQEVIGKTPAVLSSGRQDKLFYQRMWDALMEKGFWQGEIWNKRKNGQIFAEMLSITAIITPEGNTSHYVGSFTDVTESKEAEAEIHRLAYYDALTKLPNRRLLQDRLGQALAAVPRSGLYGAIFFIDLDNFKALNDTRGHDIGDLLLVEVAQRLRSAVREGDTVARQGGDEFVVLMEELGSDINEAAALAKQLGDKLRETIDQPFLLHEYEYHCKLSIGVSLFHENDTVENLLKHADLALYQAKNAGRNTLRFFDPDMQAALDLRSALEAELRQAVKRNELRLFYQPQVDSSRAVISVEALIRWQHPQRGLVLPNDFIPMAEDSGLILPIGLWVLETACAQIKTWEKDAIKRELKVAVNVSARQFRQPDFVAQVQSVLAQSGANPQRLKLELTESMVLEDIEDTIAKMQAIKELGVRFSMDDFGTGFSSLSYLAQLPLDQLKIDRSFVFNLPGTIRDETITRTIITMGLGLTMNVIAEGVETEAQLEFLEVHGCHSYQGYLFSRPLPIEALELFLQRG